MAIVKVSYTKSRKKIKASVRYIQHRPGKEGERLNRSLFGLEGLMSREEAYELIDNALKGTTFFRIVISPDPKREDTDRDLNLQEITEQTLLALAKALGQHIAYVGAIHDDHAPHRHVHAIAMIQGKLTREHFQVLRQSATEAALLQRRERDQAHGVIRDKPRLPGVGHRPVFVHGGGAPPKRLKTCTICGMESCLLHDDGLQLER